MKKFLFLFLILFTSGVYAQYYSIHKGVHTDSVITQVGSMGILKLTNQTINVSVTAGEVCELTTSGWDEADASSQTTSDGMLGIYIGSNTIIINGIYTTVGLSTGTLYWLSETEGQWTSIQPSSVGTVVKFVGQALSTTQLLIGSNIWGVN